MAAGVPPPWAPQHGGGAAGGRQARPPTPLHPRPPVHPHQPPPPHPPPRRVGESPGSGTPPGVPLTDAWWAAARDDVLTRLRSEAAASSSAGLAAAAVALDSDPAAFDAAAADLAAALGLGSGRAADATHVARAAPGLLALPKAQLVDRMLALRAALPPGVDTGALVSRAPFLLACDGGPDAVRAALAQLAALMPGLDVDERLAGAAVGGGSFLMSFCDLARQALAEAKRRRSG